MHIHLHITLHKAEQHHKQRESPFFILLSPPSMLQHLLSKSGVLHEHECKEKEKQTSCQIKTTPSTNGVGR